MKNSNKLNHQLILEANSININDKATLTQPPPLPTPQKKPNSQQLYNSPSRRAKHLNTPFQTNSQQQYNSASRRAKHLNTTFQTRETSHRRTQLLIPVPPSGNQKNKLNKTKNIRPP